jgi:hypothetical protein
MKTRLILLVLVSITFFSCKNGGKNETTPPAVTSVVENKNTMTLCNYSDENWKKGIGLTYKMFLTDNTPGSGTQLVLADGKTIPYVGYEVTGGFIQILLNEEATQYTAAAEFPNVITVK